MNTTTVQPSWVATEVFNESCKNRLIASGVDQQVADDLTTRLVGKPHPVSKFEAAATNAFIDTIVDLTRHGCRLVSVS